MRITITLPDHTTATVTEDNKIIIDFDEKKTRRDLWINQFGLFLEDKPDEKILDFKHLRVYPSKKLKLEK